MASIGDTKETPIVEDVSTPRVADPNPVLGTDDVEGDIPARISTTTTADALDVQKYTSGPSNPQVDDRIQNALTNEDVVNGFPKRKNAAGIEQVWIGEDGFVDGTDVAADGQAAKTDTKKSTNKDA